MVCFLTPDEVDALLAAPPGATTPCWSWPFRPGCGFRACRASLSRRRAGCRCLSKGRKERVTPLTTQTVAVLRAWLQEWAGDPDDPLFPTRRGGPLSTAAVVYLLTMHAAAATQRCPSLPAKRISPHVLGHTTAMNLLQAGIDTSVIALWLGPRERPDDPDLPPRRTSR